MKKNKNIFYEGAIASEKISATIQQHSTQTNIGAHSLFLGQVRSDQKENNQVEAIMYTAYTEMALVKMTEIREDLFARYPLTCLHVYHSIGRVAVGEICLFVLVSAKHRKAAMEACEVLVEAIKNKLPIWGKEICTNSSSYWKENQ